APPPVAAPPPVVAAPPPVVAAPPPVVAAPAPEPAPSAPRAATPPAPPLSAPRAVSPSLSEDDEDGDRVTPPPESGRQKAPAESGKAAARPEASLPFLGGDEPESIGTLIGVGGGDAPPVRQTPPSTPDLTGPAQVVAARAPVAVVPVKAAAAPPLTPKTVGELLDAALAL
ncbi:MAG TPA: hypothetical protein PLR99_29645, partial [Polyangiaceae bacterium]|nr:hypothetical protein [Polyangiaceae bacterium]